MNVYQRHRFPQAISRNAEGLLTEQKLWAHNT